MCGIAGAFSTNLMDNMVRDVRSIVNDQLYRGPDFQTVETISSKSPALVFGHNRLSIIDLRPEANQPMWDETGRFCIVYNGEVYNYLELRAELISLGHQFKTVSDTEVILAAFKEWKQNAIDKFNGPFAFALYDKELNQLWLVRDRFGIKPLYYTLQQGVLYFASNAKTFAKLFRLAPNLEYVARGLRYCVYEDEGEMTSYLGLHMLPAAHYFIASLKNDTICLQAKKYYHLELNVKNMRDDLVQQSLPALLNLLQDKFERSIDLRLRADVPVGIALSGGLDSTSIAAVVARKQKEIVGFTFGQPDIRISEGPIVAKVAKKLAMEVQYIWPSAQEIISALPRVLEIQSAPFTNLSVIMQYFVYEKARSLGMKVLLGGQGADEIFMGYRKFYAFQLLNLFKQKKYAKSFWFLLQVLPMIMAESSQIKCYWQQRHRYLRSPNIHKTLNLNFSSVCNLGFSKTDELWMRQLNDVTRFSLPTLLRYEDRNSMGNSIESRLPFMDYHLIEFGLALPEAIKLRHGYSKWPIREIMQGKIPESIRSTRSKRGFDVSLPTLLTAGLGENLRIKLHDSYSRVKEYLLPGIKIDQQFSDVNFKKHPTRFADAITLLWLGEANP